MTQQTHHHPHTIWPTQPTYGLPFLLLCQETKQIEQRKSRLMRKCVMQWVGAYAAWTRPGFPVFISVKVRLIIGQPGEPHTKAPLSSCVSYFETVWTIPNFICVSVRCDIDVTFTFSTVDHYCRRKTVFSNVKIKNYKEEKMYSQNHTSHQY